MAPQCRRWDVRLDVTFGAESGWLRFVATPAVQAALDAAPDPLSGMGVHRGCGSSSVYRVPR